MNEVMRNARTFLELTQAAKTETAGHWNKEALQRAMQWAEYFEGVYKKLQAKPGVITQFNRGLQIINTQPGAAPGLTPITFHQLQHSRRLILKILLQNPYLSGDLYSLVIDQYNHLPAGSDDTTGTAMLNQDATECAHMKAVRNTLINIKKITSEAVTRTKPNQDQVNGKRLGGLQEVEVETNAAILHQHLSHHLDAGPPSESMKEYLHSKLHEVALKPLGVEIILRVASRLLQAQVEDGMSTEENQTATGEGRCRQFVRDWLAENRAKYERKTDNINR